MEACERSEILSISDVTDELLRLTVLVRVCVRVCVCMRTVGGFQTINVRYALTLSLVCLSLSHTHTYTHIAAAGAAFAGIFISLCAWVVVYTLYLFAPFMNRTQTVPPTGQAQQQLPPPATGKPLAMAPGQQPPPNMIIVNNPTPVTYPAAPAPANYPPLPAAQPVNPPNAI